MSQKWIYNPEPDEEIVDGLSMSLGFGTFESKLLVMRGIDNYEKAREFFKPKMEDIHNPFFDDRYAKSRRKNSYGNREW